jgi:hypothetical protein
MSKKLYTILMAQNANVTFYIHLYYQCPHHDFYHHHQVAVLISACWNEISAENQEMEDQLVAQ